MGSSLAIVIRYERQALIVPEMAPSSKCAADAIVLEIKPSF